MTKSLHTGRVGAYVISTTYELKNKNPDGERFMDLNNNREGRRAASEGRPIDNSNLITTANTSRGSGYQNRNDYRDGSPGNSAPKNGATYKVGNSTIDISITGSNTADVTVNTQKTGSRITKTSSYTCTGSGKNTSCK